MKSMDILVAATILSIHTIASHAQNESGNDKPIAIILAAGDVATCKSNSGKATGKQEHTAKLLGNEIANAGNVPIAILALGDLAYGDPNTTDGSADAFKCYDRSWGQYFNKTLPVPGNHDYHVDNAKPYYKYFSSSPVLPKQGKKKGYYSVSFPAAHQGQWLLVGLNSNIGKTDESDQMKWFDRELANSKSRCVLAFSHAFVFSSGFHGHGDSYESDASVKFPAGMQPAFRKLHAHHASVIVSGHDHHFEQFSRQDPDRNKSDNGVRSFVVGTGGKKLYNVDKKGKALNYANKAPNSEAYWHDKHGILKIELFADWYRWAFISTAAANDVVLKPNSDTCNDR